MQWSFLDIGGERVMSDTKLGVFVKIWYRVVEVSFVIRVGSLIKYFKF